MTPPRSPDNIRLPAKSTLILPSMPVGCPVSREIQRRPLSPFFRARRSRETARARDTSPEVGALAKDASAESDGETSIAGRRNFRPQASAYEDGEDSGNELESAAIDAAEESEGEDDEAENADDKDLMIDEETEKNTEANAVFYEGDAAGQTGHLADAVTKEPVEDDRNALGTFGEEVEQDPLGEGPNVVDPLPSLFPAAQTAHLRRQKSLRLGLDLLTSRPVYARDRCTVTLTQGDPDAALEGSGKRLRRYVVLSDLSEESRYAVDWAIGTVARDGDEIFLISVKEDENKG